MGCCLFTPKLNVPQILPSLIDPQILEVFSNGTVTIMILNGMKNERLSILFATQSLRVEKQRENAYH